jgi:hypothetical protein
MQTTTPGPFLGSMPSPDIGGARLSRQLDLICSGLAILAAAAVWLGAWLSGTASDVAGLTKASSAVLLAAALMGMALIKTVSGWERFGSVMILEAIGRRLAMYPPGRAVRLPPEQTPAIGIAGLIEALVWRVRRLNASPSDLAIPSDSYEAALHEGRAQAQQIVSAMYQDADTLSEASCEFETLGQHLDAGGRQAGAACAATESAIIRTEQHLIALTGAVTATTAELRRLTGAAVTLSDQAFAGQRGVAAMEDSSTRLLAGIEQIEGLVKRLGTAGQSAAAGAERSGDDTATLAPLAAGIQDVALSTLAATAALRDEAAGMSAQVAAALRTAQEICSWVIAQHDLGLALSHAVSQQGEEIAGILRSLEEARSGFVTLRASVDAVTRIASTRLATTAAVREAAGRIPSHADAMAAILRNLPDFSPSSQLDF